MNITKQEIEQIIADFTQNKESVQVKKENLAKFNLNNKEHVEHLSYVEGTGGYYVKFLKYLIENTNSKNIVELGNREGFSTLAIYDGLQTSEKEFYTIDIVKDQRYCPDAMFSDRRVHFLFGDVYSGEILRQIPSNIDILFSDTIHTNFQIETEFEIYQHLLSDTALVAIDDIHINDKGIFFDRLTFEKWDLTELCHLSGWGLFLYKRTTPLSEEERRKKALDAALDVWERRFNIELSKNIELEESLISSKLKVFIKKNPVLHTLAHHTKKLVLKAK